MSKCSKAFTLSVDDCECAAPAGSISLRPSLLAFPTLTSCLPDSAACWPGAAEWDGIFRQRNSNAFGKCCSYAPGNYVGDQLVLLGGLPLEAFLFVTQDFSLNTVWRLSFNCKTGEPCTIGGLWSGDRVVDPTAVDYVGSYPKTIGSPALIKVEAVVPPP